MNTELSNLERAVLDKMLDGALPMLSFLRQQLEECSVATREFTGVGFYTTFSLPDHIPRKAGVDVRIGDVIGESPQIKDGMGFLLYVKNGVLDMLEGYTYDEPWPQEITRFELKYVNGEERDRVTLEESLGEALGSAEL